MNRPAKGSELARRKKHSTLTTGASVRSSDAHASHYCGVFVEGAPYLLFDRHVDNAAYTRARRIAESANFRTLLEATSTPCERIAVGFLIGADIDWSADHTVISAIASGKVDTGVQDVGKVMAIVMSGSHQAVAETLCIDGALASLIDEAFPRVVNASELPELTDQEVKLSLGNLQSKGYTGWQH